MWGEILDGLMEFSVINKRLLKQTRRIWITPAIRSGLAQRDEQDRDCEQGDAAEAM